MSYAGTYGASETCEFRAIENEYKPMGWLYRQMAKDVCVRCGRRRHEHAVGSVVVSGHPPKRGEAR